MQQQYSTQSRPIKNLVKIKFTLYLISSAGQRGQHVRQSRRIQLLYLNNNLQRFKRTNVIFIK